MKKKTTSSRMKGYFISLYLLISVFLVMEGALFPLYAVNNRGAESGQKVTTAQTVKDVFNFIERNSDFVFLYSKGVLSELEKKISMNMSGKKAEEILKELSSVAGLEFKINDRQVTVVKASTPQPQAVNQEIKVTGQVFDELGETIPGANVTVKGNAGIGTVTDMDGNFTLNVSKGATLVVSFIGYAPYEYVVKGTEKVIVKLAPDAQALDEVVVVGYGMQRKSSITGSISSIKSEKLKDVTTPSVANMLQGKVAGAVVAPTSGRPGDGVSIRVRGIGSIRGNVEPLWVIDGVVGSSSSELNPNDIETISILKDGSATALYGSRGANGVIQVTTKRAATGVSQIDLSAKFGVSQLQKGNLEMMSGAEYYDYVSTAYQNAGTLEAQTWLQPYLKERNFDWWDYATQSAPTQNYNIGYRYGNDRIRSYVSGDYYTEEGTIKGFDYDRFTFRSNTDYIVNKRLTLKAKIAASYRETFNQEHSLAYTSYVPWDTPWDSQGNLKKGSEGTPTGDAALTANPDDYWYSDGGSNYAYDRHLNWSKSRSNGVDLGVGFDYKIFDWLTFESNNRIGFTNNYSNSYVDPNSRSGSGTNGSYYDAENNSRSIYASQLLRFLKTFGDKHEINAYLGYDYDEYRYWDLSATAYKIFQGAEIINAGADDPEAAGTKYEKKNAALYLNVNYSFDSRGVL